MKPKLYAKKYEVENNIVLACCDKELIGKNLREGEYDITIKESFYKGNLVGDEELEQLLSEANRINLFGSRSIGVAKKQGLISDSDVIKIGKVEHAVIFKV